MAQTPADAGQGNPDDEAQHFAPTWRYQRIEERSRPGSVFAISHYCPVEVCDPSWQNVLRGSKQSHQCDSESPDQSNALLPIAPPPEQQPPGSRGSKLRIDCRQGE